MNKPNATGVRAGSPKNTSAGKIRSIDGPRVPLGGGAAKRGDVGHNDIVNKGR